MHEVNRELLEDVEVNQLRQVVESGCYRALEVVVVAFDEAPLTLICWSSIFELSWFSLVLALLGSGGNNSTNPARRGAYLEGALGSGNLTRE